MWRCRWLGAWTFIDLFCHGVLYQVLLLSESSALWGRLARTFSYVQGVSILAGLLSWVAMILAAGLFLPAVQRSMSWVRAPPAWLLELLAHASMDYRKAANYCSSWTLLLGMGIIFAGYLGTASMIRGPR